VGQFPCGDEMCGCGYVGPREQYATNDMWKAGERLCIPRAMERHEEWALMDVKEGQFMIQ
jgi:hypothetical protein